MIIFFADLDNTLIYSYKHDIGNRKKCVEIYQGREVSFMTQRTQMLLKELLTNVLIVPTTTRTQEQYNRIQLGIGTLPYALVCNGGVLFAHGIEDELWYMESLEITAKSRPVLQKAEIVLAQDRCRSLEVRNIKDLFIFTKSNQPEASVKRLYECLDTSLVDIYNYGVKIYVVPKGLDKGSALRRLARRLHPGQTIAAGDSEFDLPMLECADFALAPAKLVEHLGNESKIIKINDQMLFSEQILEYIVQLIEKLPQFS